MKKLVASKILTSAFLFLIAAGCVGTPVTFPTPVDQKYDVAQGRTVTGESCGFQLLLLIPINVNRRAEQAYGALVAQAGPDSALTDIKVQEKWFYAFVGTVYCTEMQATAYPRLAAAQAVSQK